MTSTEPSSPRRRRPGVRVRVTVVATAVVAVALVTGAVALWAVIRVSLYDGLREGAAQDASAVSSQIEETGASGLGELDDDRLLQVVDADGVVIARSEGAPTTPVTDVERPAPGVRIDGDEYVIAVEHADAGVSVIAGRSIAAADRTVTAVVIALAVGVPVLVALVGVVTWIAAGRALAPVERLRRQVGDVNSTTLNRRVAEPGTDDEIDRLARTLNDMLARLDLAQASQRRFISDASHELKSPLAVLRQQAELARAHPDRFDADELTETVLDEGARLESLVQGMLLLARADESALHPVDHDVDLDDLLFDEARRVRSLTSLEVDTDGVTATRVRGDIRLLSQVVRNLVDNAAGHARSRIALASRTTADAAVLTVADDGPGIPTEERRRVFERFVRLDRARARNDGGSGLGLAIVEEITRAHGGTVRIEGAPGLGGALAIVELPTGAHPSHP
ncbi:Signal transduction histidine kinase [Agromyces sp. CF514]|uniref:sensor histidine kinase n=1 Tax=Agromyces sp. CF514 TaxID=1881031 RepID=UPI0008E50A34|nr:HAMP domain-containing sensor histidine kinase [Agromyces sp. CF514]SFR74615.1 Signal transduction histidine kinase [Agromyces sp. CF514]